MFYFNFQVKNYITRFHLVLQYGLALKEVNSN